MFGGSSHLHISGKPLWKALLYVSSLLMFDTEDLLLRQLSALDIADREAHLVLPVPSCSSTLGLSDSSKQLLQPTGGTSGNWPVIISGRPVCDSLTFTCKVWSSTEVLQRALQLAGTDLDLADCA